MLGTRYKLDHQPIVTLNALQAAQKDIVDAKVASGEYQFQETHCVVCGGNDFELLSEKDRYGLYLPVVICRTCGLIQVSPRMTKESYESFYNTDYRKLYLGNPAPTEIFFQRQQDHGNTIKEFIEATQRGGQPVKGKFVVEIGTGAGGILQAFKDAGNRVFGTDLGSEYLEFGKEHGLDVRVGTIDEVARLDRKPDIIIYSHVLEHTLDPVAELEKVRSVLAPGGLLYIEVPGVKALTHSYRQDFLRSLQNAHTYYFSLGTLQNVAHKAGFSMLVGDEDIRSVFQAGQGRTYVSDYADSLDFLAEMELRHAHPAKRFAYGRSIRRSLIRFASLLGITALLKKWYYRIKYSS